MAADAYMSTAQVADMLNATVATVNRWAASGKLPVAMKLPGRTGANLFRREDVEAFAKEGSAA